MLVFQDANAIFPDEVPKTTKSDVVPKITKWDEVPILVRGGGGEVRWGSLFRF